MELEYETITPNLFVSEYCIYFTLKSKNLIPLTKSIATIIEKHIGTLKEHTPDTEVLKSSEAVKERSELYSDPLPEYLEALSANHPKPSGTYATITHESLRCLRISHTISAQNVEDSVNIDRWRRYKKVLENPDEYFNNFEEDAFDLVIDREKTLKNIEASIEEIKPQLPESYAGLLILHTDSVAEEIDDEYRHYMANIGRISFYPLTSDNIEKIEAAKSELIDLLKETEGPALSENAPSAIEQACILYHSSPEWHTACPDIIGKPLWQVKLYKNHIVHTLEDAEILEILIKTSSSFPFQL